MSTAIVLMPIAEVRQVAETIAKCGLFVELNGKPEAAFALMMLCQAEGLHPIEAVRQYHIIKGKPAMKADAMLAKFQARGGRVKWLETSDKACEAVFTATAMDGAVTVRWTIEDAIRAELTGPNSMYKKYPRQMLRSRAISEGVRLADPAVVVGLYTPEEVDDFESRPPVIEVTPEIRAAVANSRPYASSDGSNPRHPERERSAPAAEVPKGLAPATSAATESPATHTTLARTVESAFPAVSASIMGVDGAALYVPPVEREPGSDDDDETPAWVNTNGDQVETFRWEGADAAAGVGGEWVLSDHEPRRTNEQNAKFYALITELEIQEADYADDHGTAKKGWRALLLSQFGKESSRELSVREMSKVIDSLEKKKSHFGTPKSKRERQQRNLQDAVGEISNHLGVKP